MNFETTIAAVHELSERWHHRPAARVLRCLPLSVRELKPVPIWQQRLARLTELTPRPTPLPNA